MSQERQLEIRQRRSWARGLPRGERQDCLDLSDREPEREGSRERRGAQRRNGEGEGVREGGGAGGERKPVKDKSTRHQKRTGTRRSQSGDLRAILGR